MSELTCPYNPSHRIEEQGMKEHLFRCAKQYPKIKLKHICPYHIIHRYRTAEEMEEHKKVCPKRTEFEIQKIQPDIDTTITKIEINIATVPSNDEEEWGEVENASYKPQIGITKKPILRNNMGKTHSEKKLFRQMEYERLQKLQNNV